jgi:hypothetical protein
VDLQNPNEGSKLEVIPLRMNGHISMQKHGALFQRKVAQALGSGTQPLPMSDPGGEPT